MKEVPEAPNKEQLEVLEKKPETTEKVFEHTQAKLDKMDELALDFLKKGEAAAKKSEAEDKAAKFLELNDRARLLYESAKEKILNTFFAEDSREREIFKEGEVFQPEKELKKVLASSPEDRGKLLKEFKEKYAYQKEGIAEIQEELTKQIRENPEITFEGYRDISLPLAKKYALDSRQELAFMATFHHYKSKHEAVREARKSHPKDSMLYTYLFGKVPKGKVEVVEGPITLYFRCYDLEDYARIYSEELDDRALTKHDLEKANMSGGVSISTAITTELEGCIIAENAHSIERISKTFSKDRDLQKAFAEAVSRDTLVHEEQHAIKRLFNETFVKKNTYGEMMLSTSEKDIKTNLERWLRYMREHLVEPRAKNEILAYFKEGHDLSQVLEKLTRPKSKGGSYDYWSEYVSKHKAPEKLTVWLEYPPFLKVALEAKSKVFEQEYHKMIKDGINNVESLRKKGYSEEKIIGLLINEPLSKWPKITRRLAESEKNSNEKK